MNKYTAALLGFACLITSCGLGGAEKNDANEKPVNPEVYEFGILLNDYHVVRDTVVRGDSFGGILEKYGIYYPQIYNINNVAKKAFNFRKIRTGRPYTLLCSKDSLQTPELLIYQPNAIDYVTVKLQDSLWAKKEQKEVRLIQREAWGVINSSLYETLNEQGLSPLVAYDMSDIYAWTIDFFRLEKGDRFKVFYTEKYVNDSVFVGHNRVHAAYFEHRGKPIYAIEFESDSIRGINEFFDEKGKNLRRAFLRAPVNFSRISSRYNTKRRISYYGRVKPHYGTDFAAPVGTPIRTTAAGKVIKSGYAKGNGNYVTIRHNGTYSTQYLHMKKRGVRVGQYVGQGDYIGTVGMTGYTSGPHVCYRFWKNGKQVDPFKTKLPDAKPIASDLKEAYLQHMIPWKEKLDCIIFEEQKTNTNAITENQPNNNSGLEQTTKAL
ncbi:MAG: peptidoglycan DD-metalloendopeptidase family protein [Flavobacteriaceae bacterium]|jgi:murein DD-endopeptidase MepM/ murein hydrolase activator NlpD|nr:peptidoglycan DD-metalloendopeptidase family protein [Flavobacteriaceae bacterium]